MEEWQERLIREAKEKAGKSISRTIEYSERKIANIEKTLELKIKIIEALRENPDMLFGEADVYIKTENHKLVHDVSKALGIKLERTAEADGFNFTGKYEDIPIRIYGMQEVPHCKIVQKKDTREVTIYEAVCNEEGEKDMEDLHFKEE